LVIRIELFATVDEILEIAVLAASTFVVRLLGGRARPPLARPPTHIFPGDRRDHGLLGGRSFAGSSGSTGRTRAA
jgi:hypothetical protein